MSVKRDYYEILGVSRTADASAIKKAYRKLAKKYHPDSNAGNGQAEGKFKEATEAYAILSDPEKRKLYDQYGHAAFDESAGQSGPSYSNRDKGTWEYHFESGDLDDIWKHFFGGGFGGFGQGPIPRKGQDLHAGIEIGFREAVSGCEKVIQITKSDGSKESLKVRIPAGIDTGKSIRLRGKGMPGRGGGEPGDLLMEVTVNTCPGFERKGLDIYTTVRIPFSTAVLGGEAVVETLSGSVVCKIRPGIQSGAKIRLKGKGVASMQEPQKKGDQYVTVQIEVPQHISEEAKRKLREFDASCGKKNHGAA